MATDIGSPDGPSDKGVHYERVDEVTVNMYVEGPGDTTVRPASAAVQAALVQALETWARRGVPEDPAGWLYRTARNLEGFFLSLTGPCEGLCIGGNPPPHGLRHIGEPE